MKTEMLLKDPVFQLNLLVWMAKEQPREKYRVRPFFCEIGFSIIYIKHPFPFPEKIAKQILSSSLPITHQPEPELMLGRQRDGKALCLEAKANSFGVQSDNCKQARGHLLASGPVFGEVFSPLSDCMLCYVLPEDKRRPMSECLASLSTELEKHKFSPGQYCTHGLSVDGTTLMYSWDTSFSNYSEADDDRTAVLDGLAEDTDPTPLLLVYSDEDCHDDEMRDMYRRAVIEQVRVVMLCDLHKHTQGDRYEATPEELLMKTTDGVYEYLGRKCQKGLRNLVRVSILKHVADYWKEKQTGIKFVDGALTVEWKTKDDKENFLRWLEDRRVKFDRSKPPEEHLPLFD